MTDSQGAGKPAPKFDPQKVDRDMSWIGARLREKSTYAGLAVLLGLVGLGSNSGPVANDISLIGMGIGGLLAVLLPEKGAAKVLAAFAIASAALAFAHPAHAAASKRVPLPAPRPIFDVVQRAKPGRPTVVEAQQNPLVVLQQFTVADLQAALKDAQVQTPPDNTAAGCYTALIPFVQNEAQNSLPQGAGIFQALQKARDAKAYLANIQSPTGPLAGLNQACAPLVLDVQNTLLTLGVSVGVVANPAGAAATAAGLPAAVAAFLGLPKLIP